MIPAWRFAMLASSLSITIGLLSGCATPTNELTITYGSDAAEFTIHPESVTCTDTTLTGTVVGQRPTGAFTLHVNQDRPTGTGRVWGVDTRLIEFFPTQPIRVSDSDSRLNLGDVPGTVTVSIADEGKSGTAESEEVQATLSGTLVCDPQLDSRTHKN